MKSYQLTAQQFQSIKFSDLSKLLESQTFSLTKCGNSITLFCDPSILPPTLSVSTPPAIHSAHPTLLTSPSGYGSVDLMSPGLSTRSGSQTSLNNTDEDEHSYQPVDGTKSGYSLMSLPSEPTPTLHRVESATFWMGSTNRDDAHASLIKHPRGTYILRASLSPTTYVNGQPDPNLFVMQYIDIDGKVYLVASRCELALSQPQLFCSRSITPFEGMAVNSLHHSMLDTEALPSPVSNNWRLLSSVIMPHLIRA